MTDQLVDPGRRTDDTDLDYDVIVIGAGVAGIYQIKRLADLGLRATVLEAGGDLGGTWYWNRYPGCRFDSESYTYGYSWSQEVLDEWHWTERFSSQPENLRYLSFVADKFDLRRHMQFGAVVTSAHYDDDDQTWSVTLEDGRSFTTRFLITALGLLSAATPPRYPGVDTFRGQSWHTYYWPHEPVDLTGKRVGVVGTGATAIQLIPVVAEQAEHLTVFQRRPNWAAPLHNGPDRRRGDGRYPSPLRRDLRGVQPDPGRVRARARPARLRRLHRRGTTGHLGGALRQARLRIWLGNFRETFMDPEANAELSAFIAEKIRERVDDPALAEKLIPTDHGFGVQRVPLETNYFETYNRDDVRLLDLSETPIERVTETGIRTTAEDVELDIIVWATGFDAMTGAYDRIDIRGSGGRKLADTWADGPSTFFGLMIHGYPNLVMLAGPRAARPRRTSPGASRRASTGSPTSSLTSSKAATPPSRPPPTPRRTGRSTCGRRTR